MGSAGRVLSKWKKAKLFNRYPKLYSDNNSRKANENYMIRAVTRKKT
jgi:hypothetical protein